MLLVDNRSNTDPFINLALEEYLVREAECREPLLCLYINEPCVVLGKNQSVWQEVNLNWMLNGGVVARRVSGGGTVYHDEGNLNISFILPFEERLLNNYRYINQTLFEWLRSLGLPVSFSKRNDILCDGKKISGNAQFTNRKKLLSHCTLLINADKNALHAALAANEFTVQTNAVRSVRSQVANLSEWQPQLDVASIRQPISVAHDATDLFTLSDTAWQQVLKLAAEKYSSFEWIYGRSPSTALQLGNAQVGITNGLIKGEKAKPGLVADLLRFSP